MSVHNATMQPLRLLTWKFTLERNLTRAIIVNTKQLHLLVWEGTWWSILEKRKRCVQFATTPVLQQKIWKYTWWWSMQEKGHTSVISATTLTLILVTWKGTWWFTLERNYSSATSAKKTSNGESSWQDIPKCIWPEYEYSRLVVVDDFDWYCLLPELIDITNIWTGYHILFVSFLWNNF